MLKDLCLSNNPLKELVSVDHLTKLKVLIANACRLQNVSLNKLESLEFLSLSDNLLTSVPKIRNLQKLVNLDLSGNPLSIGFEELETVKSLQVLDLARTGLDMSIQQFYQFILTPLKKLPKLTHVSFAENPVEVSIIKFRLFVISELPKLKYVDWMPITKEERAEFPKHEKLWKDKTLPAQPLKAPAALVSRAPRMGASRAAGATGLGEANESLLGPDDKALVNFLLGDDAGASNADLGAPKAAKSKESALDDFLQTAEGSGTDPLKDIMTFLNEEEKPASAGGGGGGGGGGGDYEDELMRIIYGDNKPPQQQPVAQQADEEMFDTINADLDAFAASAPAKIAPVVQSPATGGRSAADTELDDLLNTIISVEENRSAGGSATPQKQSSAIDLLLAQEEDAKRKRLEEERKRVEEERARLERERLALEEAKQRELEIEKARIRAEMEAQKQREIDEARKAAAKSFGKNTQALEDDAMALLEMMDLATEFSSDPANTAAPAPKPTKISTAEQDADDLLASIDMLVGSTASPSVTQGKGPAGGGVPSPTPVKKASSFGPKSSAATAAPVTPKVLPGGALPIARRKQDDNDLDTLLSEAKVASPVTAAKGGGTPPWLAFWSQISFGDRLGVGSLGITSIGWCRTAEVTVKKLKLQRFTDQFLQKFQDDVPELVALNHPNLVKFVGVCIDDSLCTLHGYIRGCNLWGYLRNEGNLVDLPFITKISRGVASGVAYLHSKKIIHRNLHSKNILLDGEMIPKLRDYGLPFIKAETYQLAMGPVSFEAPELLKREAFTEAVDAYSFGVVLWEMFAREEPYKGLQPGAIRDRVIAQEMRPDVTPDIPVVFRKLMGACWNTDPQRRPTMVVVGKILNKPAEELGAYGTEGGSGPITSQPKLQGPAAARAASAAPAVDLVETLQAPDANSSIGALMQKIIGLLESQDRLTQQRGLRVVYNLCEKKEYADQRQLMRSIVPSLINRAKAGNDKTTRDLALQALGKLCVAPECAEEFLQMLGWPTLLQAMESGDISLELAASMLMVVLLKDPQNKDAFVSVKGVPALVRALISETETVRTNAVWAASLALENVNTQEKFVEERGVPIILKLAQSTNPGVVLRVLVSVGLLLTNPAVFHELKDSGVIQRFLRLLSSPSALLQQHGIEAIGRFSEMPELRELLYRANGISNMLELLNATSDAKVKRLVVVALSNFLDDEHDATYIEQAQALRPVVRLMVSNDSELRLEALRMISKAASVPSLRLQLQSMGAISPLVQLLNARDKQLRMASLYSVCVMSEDESVSIALALADCAAQLLRICEQNPTDGDVLELAAETLGNLARSASGVAQMRESGAFPFLVRLLSNRNPTVVEGAATALVHASSLPEGRLTIAALDGVVPLLQLCNSDDEVLREAVLWSCPNWCDGTTVEAVVTVALPAIVAGLTDSKESVQSIAVKTVLILASNADYKSTLKRARVVEGLASLERTTKNPTLKLASQKATAILQK